MSTEGSGFTEPVITVSIYAAHYFNSSSAVEQDD